MRGLVEVAVRRRVTVVMTSLAVAAFGMVGYSRLSLELFPDIAYPSITVQTDLPDAAPQEVENLITRPVEEAVGVLRGLQTIHSVSRQGTSEVTLEFDWGSDMDILSMEVREKLDRLILPEESEQPIVMRFDPSLDPIQRIAFAGDDDLRRLRHVAERRIKPDLETLRGVAAAQVRGGLEEEIQIEVDQERLAALGIPLDRLREVVQAGNVNRPGGKLEGADSQYLIRVVNEFDDIEEIGDLIIYQEGDASVRLKEVATVRRGAKDREEITRVNGRESIEISVYKEGDANTVTVAQIVGERLEDWRAKIPPGHTLTVLFDQSLLVRQAVDEVRNAALGGGLLTVLVLLVFLRDIRSTLIIATSIPLSVVATLLVMYRADISLNLMSLGGLTLGVGMIVDNSIVVLESIFRRRKEGLDLRRAAVEGTAEVGAAVIASTLTTVAVFIPMVFVEGIAGQLFGDQAMTVTISMLASVIVAVTVVPMLSAAGRSAPRAQPEAGVTPPETGVAPPAEQAMTLGRLSRAYDVCLRAAVRRPWLSMGTAAVLFGVSVAALRGIGTELIPPLGKGEFYFEVRMPEGVSLAATDRRVLGMEESAARQPLVDRVYSTVGSRLVAGGMSLNTRAENLGQLNVVMSDGAGEAAEAEVIRTLRREFAGIPDLEVKFGRPSYFSLRTPIEVILFGEDIEDLRISSLSLMQSLESVPGLTDLRSSLEAGNPELQVVFDRRRLASLGLEMRTLSDTLQTRIQGAVPTRFNEPDRQIDIRIRNLEKDRSSVGDVPGLVVPGPSGSSLRLVTVANVKEARGPAEIHRLQQQRAAVVTASVTGRSLSAAIEDVEAVIAGSPGLRGTTVELGGQNREMQQSFASLRFALILAIFLVYLVMAATFESFIHPLIVLFTIPLSLIGVVAGLLATGTDISIMVLIGCIVLAGIVVNNAIVLIDAANRLRGQGLDRVEAVVRAGHIRMRPILMTSSTTILGVIPMAIKLGEGSELSSPLAITVASGLAVSTLLTLLVIPAAYALVPARSGLHGGEAAWGGTNPGAPS